jgi:hypothetical protein
MTYARGLKGIYAEERLTSAMTRPEIESEIASRFDQRVADDTDAPL